MNMKIRIICRNVVNFPLQILHTYDVAMVGKAVWGGSRRGKFAPLISTKARLSSQLPLV